MLSIFWHKFGSHPIILHLIIEVHDKQKPTKSHQCNRQTQFPSLLYNCLRSHVVLSTLIDRFPSEVTTRPEVFWKISTIAWIFSENYISFFPLCMSWKSRNHVFQLCDGFSDCITFTSIYLYNLIMFMFTFLSLYSEYNSIRSMHYLHLGNHFGNVCSPTNPNFEFSSWGVSQLLNQNKIVS